MDLVGERWALPVARELMLGPKRFADLKRAMPGISAPVLSQRLKDLEEVGVLVRETMGPPVSAQVYRLTEWGLELEGVLQALGNWAVKSPFRDPDAPMAVTSLILSLRTMFSAEAAAEMAARIQLVLDGEPFRMLIENGTLEIDRGTEPSADAALAGTPDAIVAFVYNDIPLDRLERAGGLSASGDRRIIAALPSIFALLSG
ncbi:winged helix-turn-helix transcriptional regulator [Pacificimonas flava]|nr:winged helix-turn-helix transcriptional regulator [Pacificimonas flava]MBB5280302.1 DNA-binding HxlR family transcriptional regulator [Pacificimonas flava]